MIDWNMISEVASKGVYPDNCKAMLEILEKSGWKILKFPTVEAWRKKYFPRRKKEAFDIAQVAYVQQAVIGKDRIGEAPFEVALALSEALNEERLEEVVAALGGWKKAIKCYPKKIRDKLYEQYPGLKIKRELSIEEAAEHRRLKNISTLKFAFEELSLIDKYEFFVEHCDKFIIGDFPKELKYYIRVMSLMENHLRQFKNIIELGVEEATDPTIFMYANCYDDEFGDVEL